jgi:predicted nucleotidyltransferase
MTEEEMETYRAAARWHQEQELRASVEREKRAWELARRAAALLREQFSATRVVVFGSLVHARCFTPWSDVDVAAWGLCPDDTFRAFGVVMDMDSEIQVNLVDVNTCHSALLNSIEREGVEL